MYGNDVYLRRFVSTFIRQMVLDPHYVVAQRNGRTQTLFKGGVKEGNETRKKLNEMEVEWVS